MGTAWLGKKWPIDYWQRLFIDLVASGYQIIFIGSNEEQGLYKEFYSGLTSEAKIKIPLQSQNLMGETSLSQLVPILSQAAWLITGDTVSMHL